MVVFFTKMFYLKNRDIQDFLVYIYIFEGAYGKRKVFGGCK